MLNSTWQERLMRFDEGEIEVAWLCGLPYVQRVGQPENGVELLAAPVMMGERYKNQPIYFSDVIVRTDSRYKDFYDLARTRWAYNERTSHSGYNVVRHHLATIQQPKGFFARVIDAGSHENALQLLLKGEIEATAIDSTVLETEIRRHPEYRAQIRVIEILGPSPIPPFLVRSSLDEDFRRALQDAFLGMHQDPVGREVLARHGYLRFIGVRDADYDPIRRMKAEADEAGVELAPV
jgi:phosphonate transport system substrate-binding protein